MSTLLRNTFLPSVPAKFKDKRASLSGKRGQLLKLECTAEGDTPITIYWSKDSSPITKITSHRYDIKDSPKEGSTSSILTIRSVEIGDEGFYSCLAENSAGKDERSIKVTIIEPPMVPSSFSARQVWTKSATVAWARQSVTKAPITGYTIHYWKASVPPKNDKLYEVNVSSSVDSHLLSELMPGSSYEACIMSMNEVGASLISKPIKFTTQEEAPQSPPTDFEAIARSPYSIRLTWSPPMESSWNGRIGGYKVGYKQGKDYNGAYSYRSVDASHHNTSYEFILTHLAKDTAYSVVVKAVNRAGESPDSQALVVKTLLGDVPIPPRINLLSALSDSITLKYSTLQPKMINILYLRVFFKEVDEYYWREYSIIPEDESDSGEYILKNLNPSTIYMIYATATNEYGDSDASQIVRARTARSTRSTPGTKAFLESDMDVFWAYFPILPVTIALAIVIIVIVIAYVYVRKVQIDASKPNLELCSTSLPPTLRYRDVNNGRPLIQTSLIDGDYQCPVSFAGTLNGRPMDCYPTMGSKTSSKAGSMDSESKHVYDNPY